MTVAAQQQIQKAFNSVAEHMTAISKEMTTIGELIQTGEISKKAVVRKTKVKRDPNEPKKPLSSYFLFSIAMRGPLKERMPNAGSNELAVQLGVIWRAMSAAEKQEYIIEHEKRKEQYAIELAEYKKKKDAAGEFGDATALSSADQEEHVVDSPVVFEELKSSASSEPDVVMSTPKSEKSPTKTSYQDLNSKKKRKESSENDSPKPKKSKKSKKAKFSDPVAA